MALALLVLSWHVAAVAKDECPPQVVEYSSAGIVRLEGRLIVTRGKGLAAVDGAKRIQSPQQTASVVITQSPNTSKPGPWNTSAVVVGNESRPIELSLVVKDHAYDVRFKWINEQLLFIQVWWGRSVSADVILNVDTGRFLYAEEAAYHALSAPCERER